MEKISKLIQLFGNEPVLNKNLTMLNSKNEEVDASVECWIQ